MQAVDTSEENKTLVPPSAPGEWSLAEIQAALKRPLPTSYLGKLRDKGNADYIPWYRANEILDKYAPGWTWEIRETSLSEDRIFLVGRLTIPTREGNVYREASGTEELKREKIDKKTGEVEILELAFGDPSSNAESMAFRRAAARFGLGIYLYYKDGETPPEQRSATPKKQKSAPEARPERTLPAASREEFAAPEPSWEEARQAAIGWALKSKIDESLALKAWEKFRAQSKTVAHCKGLFAQWGKAQIALKQQAIKHGVDAGLTETIAAAMWDETSGEGEERKAAFKARVKEEIAAANAFKFQQEQAEPVTAQPLLPNEDSHFFKSQTKPSDAQLRRFHTIAYKEGGYSKEGLKAMLIAFGYQSSKEILATDYEFICQKAGDPALAERYNAEAAMPVAAG